MSMWTEGGHGVTIETENVGAYEIKSDLRARTKTYTWATLHTGATLLTMYEKTDSCEIDPGVVYRWHSQKRVRTHAHTHETTTSTNPWSLEVVPLVYGALCQVGCFFNSSSFCVFRRPLKDDQAAQDQSKQRHRWGIGMQLKSTSSKNMIQKNLQRFRQRARRDRKKGVIQ